MTTDDEERVETARRAAEGEAAPLSLHELSVALLLSVQRWEPYERAHHPYPYRSDGLQCRHCKARAETAGQVRHDGDCPYRLARRILNNAREEGLI